MLHPLLSSPVLSYLILSYPIEVNSQKRKRELHLRRKRERERERERERQETFPGPSMIGHPQFHIPREERRGEERRGGEGRGEERRGENTVLKFYPPSSLLS